MNALFLLLMLTYRCVDELIENGFKNNAELIRKTNDKFSTAQHKNNCLLSQPFSSTPQPNTMSFIFNAIRESERRKKQEAAEKQELATLLTLIALEEKKRER